MKASKYSQTIYRVSDTRWMSAARIKGSPCFHVKEVYPEPQSPTGWYAEPGDFYIPASTPEEAIATHIQTLISR